jgi:hypothetical protein
MEKRKRVAVCDNSLSMAGIAAGLKADATLDVFCVKIRHYFNVTEQQLFKLFIFFHGFDDDGRKLVVQPYDLLAFRGETQHVVTEVS